MDRTWPNQSKPALSGLQNQSHSTDQEYTYLYDPVHRCHVTDLRTRSPQRQKPTTISIHDHEIAAALPQSFVVEKTVQHHPGPNSSARRWPKIKSTRQGVLHAMAAAVFIFGIGVSLNGLLANRRVAAQINQTPSQGQSDHTNNSTANLPSTDKPTGPAIAGYTVGPNQGRYIDIPKLDVRARILSVGVDSDGQMGVPNNIYDTAWYNGSALPGRPGAMLVNGHISFGVKGVFYDLKDLVTGDPIRITRGDGQKFIYKVVKTRIFDANKVDMDSLMISSDIGRPGLNLISCFGDIIPGKNEFDKRIAVYAVLY